MIFRLDSKTKAFSLVEVVLAVGIIVSALVILFALIGGAVSQARQVLDDHLAIRASDAVSAYLRSRPFDTVYGWTQANRSLFVCTYRADKGSTAPNAPLSPVNNATGQPGVDYRLATIVSNDSSIAPEAGATDIRLFLARLSVSPSNSTTTLPALASYVEGALMIEVRLYALPTLGSAATIAVGRPDFVFNTAVTR